MVYLDGDTDLEGAGIDDFLEMSAAGSDANVNIVVHFDRIDGYDSSYGDWTSCKRFYVTVGMTPTAANAVVDIGEPNMGDPAALTAFIDWGATNYPANQYAVILWNHGGGWREQQEALMKALEMAKTGEEREEIRRALREIRRPNYKAVCWDDTNGDVLYMKEVQSVFNAATVDMDLIGFDACLMGMIEVAYEIKDTGASVMVGSEESVPWDGWPYDEILSDLTSTPSWTPSQLGTGIVDRYYESYGDDQTQAAIDLGHMDTLGSAVNDLAHMMRNSWNTDQLAVQAAAQSVMDEGDVAVVHERHGSSWSGSHGLAIYFPATRGQFDTDYNGSIIDFPADTLWEEFPADFYTAMGGSWVEAARLVSQTYYNDEHIDLYDFCAHIVLIVGEPPIANAGPDQTVNERDTVTLDGSNSTDPNDDIATYQWQQTGGISIILSDATAVQPTFTAPDVGSDGASLTFQLTVTDTIGLQSTDTCIVNVSSGSGGGDGVYFIAAAACGLAMEPYVKILPLPRTDRGLPLKVPSPPLSRHCGRARDGRGIFHFDNKR